MNYRKLLQATVLFILAGLFMTACSSVQTTQSSFQSRELQWPALPMEPKIQWVKEIRNHWDMGLKRSFWSRFWGFIVGQDEMGIVKPYGIYGDNKQRLFVADVGAGIVHIFDFGAGRYATIAGKDEASFRTPIGITGDDNDNIFITDAGSGVIYRYSTKNETLDELTPFKLQRPTGIAYNRVNGLLYISDTTLHQVIAIDLGGQERFRFGARGTAPGQFNFPTDITVDSLGRVIVTDALNARIQIFTPEGISLGTFGKHGDSAGYFAKPKGVALDSAGHIYVCDALFDSVQIFDDTGRLLLHFGDSGGNPGQFWLPSGIHVDRNDNIYVADTYNKRIQVFKYLK